MATLGMMLKQSQHKEAWQKYCGFLDMSLEDFMQVQERLLMEQIELLSNCELGHKIMGKGIKPKTIQEFREQVPLTTYEDYAEYLLEKREDVLPEKPAFWISTTWKGGQYPIKLAPYSENMIREHAKAFIASLLLATSDKRGDFSLAEDDKFLYGMAPLPYLTGLTPYGLKNEINFEYLPPIDEAQTLSFEKRNEVGFDIARREGIDLFFGLSSVLVRIGESFVHDSEKHSRRFVMPTNPKIYYRMIKAFFKKKIKKQPILPKDLWIIKGILCAGTDTAAFKDKIEYYWGKRPIEIYGGTEIATAATETWGDTGLTFFPDSNFLEFIPEKDSLRSLGDKSFIPKTLLINEIKPGQRYELVITKFRGGAFIRYRVGDIIECLSLKNEEHKIDMPQVAFVDRVANIIDLAGFTRITGVTIDRAIESSGLSVREWAACKEYASDGPVLHMYMEMDEVAADVDDVKQKINLSLNELDPDFRDIQSLLGKDPLCITMLGPGTFDAYTEIKGEKIFKINPGEQAIRTLININQNSWE